MLLKNPSLTLYAFQLCSSLGNTQEADAQSLWPRLGEALGLANWSPQSPWVAAECASDTPYQCLPMQSFTHGERNLAVMPLVLHDLYALDVTFTLPQNHLDSSELARLHPDFCLSRLQASVGQTLLFYAEPDSAPESWPTLAQACFQTLSGQASSAFVQGSGSLGGGQVFEYSDEQKQHWLIWFGTENTVSFIDADFNYHWLHWLASRHKLAFAWGESRVDNREARRRYADLEQQIAQLQQVAVTESGQLSALEQTVPAARTRQFRAWCKKHAILKKQIEKKRLAAQKAMVHDTPTRLLELTQRIRNLGDHAISLEINQENHARHVAEIETRAQGKLDFAQDFQKRARQRVQQLQADRRFLEPAVPLFEQTLRSIHSSVEINTLEHLHQMEADEYRRQEDLEMVVAFIASLLEATAISVKVDHALPHKLAEVFSIHVEHLPVYAAQLFGIATHLVVIGLPAALLTVFLLMLWQKHRDARPPSSKNAHE